MKRAVLPQYVIADWDHDPYIRGCYSAARIGRADARAELARPIENRLFFAGEACSTNYMGDVHGAWFTGIAAAEAAWPAERWWTRYTDINCNFKAHLYCFEN